MRDNHKLVFNLTSPNIENCFSKTFNVKPYNSAKANYTRFRTRLDQPERPINHQPVTEWV